MMKTRTRRSKAAPVLAGTILLGAVMIGLAINPITDVLGIRTPQLTATPSTVHQGESYTINGTGFNKYRNIILRYSDGEPDVYIRTTGGTFSYTKTMPMTTPIGDLVISAYQNINGTTGALITTLGDAG